MITGPTASPSIQAAPRGLTPTPGLVSVNGGGAPAMPGNSTPPGIDRIVLTPAARLDLLVADAEARLRNMESVLEEVLGPGQEPASIGLQIMTQLVPAVHAVGTAVDTAMDAATAALATGKSLPGQEERATSLVMHVSVSLQAASVRLTHTLAIADATLTGSGKMFADDGDRGISAPATGQLVRSDRGGEANRIGTDLPDPLAVAVTLETVQEVMARLANRRTVLHASGTMSASRIFGPEDRGIPAQDGKLRPPPWPGLFCLLVGLVLAYRVDLGPMQHAAMLLAVLMSLVWCGRELVRRLRTDHRRSWPSGRNRAEPASQETFIPDLASPGTRQNIQSDLTS